MTTVYVLYQVRPVHRVLGSWLVLTSAVEMLDIMREQYPDDAFEVRKEVSA